MNILFISNLYPAYPGQSRTEMTYALHQFAKEWIKTDEKVLSIALWDCYPALFSFFSDFAKKKKEYNTEELFHLDLVPILRMPTFKIPHFPYTQREINRLRKRILINLNDLRYKPDILVVHGLYPAQIASSIKSELQIPMITGIHSTDTIRIRKKRFPEISRRILRESDSLAFRSMSLKNQLMQTIPELLADKNSFVAFSGVTQQITISQDQLAEKISRRNKDFIIMSACHLKRRKNIHLLIKAFARMKNRRSELIILGDGPEKKRLEGLARDLDVSERIRFVGYQPRTQVFEFMREADIFVLASHSETLGLVYLEAMASGCITVGTKGEGIDGVIENGVNGFLVTPDEASLVRTLHHILELSPEKRLNILSNALKTTSAMTEQKCAAHYLKNIQAVVKDFNGKN